MPVLTLVTANTLTQANCESGPAAAQEEAAQTEAPSCPREPPAGSIRGETPGPAQIDQTTTLWSGESTAGKNQREDPRKNQDLSWNCRDADI